MLRTVALAILIGRAVPAQEFEVASIKQVPARTVTVNGGLIEHGTGGPGSADPGMFRCGNCFLLVLIEQAFDLKRHQFADPQPWMMQSGYQVLAKVPEGATRQQFLIMLQNFIKERFRLTYHFEKKQVEGLALMVAKGGPKLRQSTAAKPVPTALPADERVVMGKDGCPELKHPGKVALNGRIRWRIDHQTMGEVARWLGDDYDLPVEDATGLEGAYDIHLFFVANSMRSTAPGPDGPASPDRDSGPSFVEAIQSQLGLKLEPRKVMVDVFVIDHIEKTPIAN